VKQCLVATLRLPHASTLPARSGEFVTSRHEAWVGCDLFWRLHSMEDAAGAPRAGLCLARAAAKISRAQ